MKKRGIFGKAFWVVLVIVSSLFLFTSWFGGEVLGLYDTARWFDKALHAFGGILFTVIGFWVASRSDSKKPFFIAMFAFCFCVTVLLLWEFFEFFIDLAFGTNMLRWQDMARSKFGSGLHDTMWDLILGAAAALLTSIGIWIWLRIRKE